MNIYKKASYDRKISELNETTKDSLFQNDLNEISEDFNYTDSEGWDQNILIALQDGVRKNFDSVK